MCVEPQFTLMFSPLGVLPTTVTSAPSALNTLSASCQVEPLAQSSPTRRPL